MSKIRVDDVPYLGRILEFISFCNVCSFRSINVSAMDVRKPTRFQAKIKGEKGLKVRVVRSNTGILRIPELGVRIDPGPACQGFVSNVEGVLHRVMEIADLLEMDSEGIERERVIELRNKIKLALDGKLEFTLIVEDPFGNSGLYSDEEYPIDREELSEEEANVLKRTIGIEVY